MDKINQNLTDNNSISKETEIFLVAGLLSSGISFNGISSEGNQIIFLLNDKTQVEVLKKKYGQGQLQVDAKLFEHYIKFCRSLIYSNRKSSFNQKSFNGNKFSHE